MNSKGSGMSFFYTCQNLPSLVFIIEIHRLAPTAFAATRWRASTLNLRYLAASSEIIMFIISFNDETFLRGTLTFLFIVKPSTWVVMEKGLLLLFEWLLFKLCGRCRSLWESHYSMDRELEGRFWPQNEHTQISEKNWRLCVGGNENFIKSFEGSSSKNINY